MSMDDTIKLDRRSFEALAADSRVRILKSLAVRRKTLTELAKELDLSNSTMKEHLDVLVRAGLIIQRDEGRKWKYYDLTRKGESIVNPNPTKVLIMLAVSMILVIATGWNFVGSFGVSPDFGAVSLGGAAVAEAPAAETFAMQKAAMPMEADAAAGYAYASEEAPPPEAKALNVEEESSWEEDTYPEDAEAYRAPAPAPTYENEVLGGANYVAGSEEAEAFPTLAALAFVASILLLGASLYYLLKRW